MSSKPDPLRAFLGFDPLSPEPGDELAALPAVAPPPPPAPTEPCAQIVAILKAHMLAHPTGGTNPGGRFAFARNLANLALRELCDDPQVAVEIRRGGWIMGKPDELTK